MTRTSVVREQCTIELRKNKKGDERTAGMVKCSREAAKTQTRRMRNASLPTNKDDDDLLKQRRHKEDLRCCVRDFF